MSKALAHNSIAACFGGFGIFGSDEQLHLAAAGRHGREIVFDDVGAYLAYQPEEKCHAVS